MAHIGPVHVHEQGPYESRTRRFARFSKLPGKGKRAERWSKRFNRKVLPGMIELRNATNAKLGKKSWYSLSGLCVPCVSAVKNPGHNGPVLRHGLQELHGHKIILPKHKSDCPDKERLEVRFGEFRR